MTRYQAWYRSHHVLLQSTLSSVDQNSSTTGKSRKTKKTRAKISSKPKSTSLSVPRGYNARWDSMITRLSEFRDKTGHSLVTKQDDPDLFRWVLSIRKNYNPPDRENPSERTDLEQQDVQPSRWANNYRRTVSKKRKLPPKKMRQLEELDFCWTVQGSAWDRRYSELQAFHADNGHCQVPMIHPSGLGVWVKNQKREYRRLETGEHSTLSRDRLEKLHALSFTFSRSRKEAWEEKYNELVEFYREHGHSNVPENYEANPSLGSWCANQRTAYRRHLEQGLPDDAAKGPLSREKIQLLRDVEFIFQIREERWQSKLDKLQTYYKQHGHVRIPEDDLENRDIRVWVSFQRYYYNLRQRLLKQISGEGVDKVKVPLTESRIEAIEKAIPNFEWKLRDSSGGPSREDWADLFQAMRDKGIKPGMRAKQHWFEGENRFQVNMKDVWTEQDLLELWNQEDDDEDGIDFAFDAEVGMVRETEEGNDGDVAKADAEEEASLLNADFAGTDDDLPF